MFRQKLRIMTNLKIAALLLILALASWRPLKEQRANIVRAVAAAAMNSVVKAQAADAMNQNDLDASAASTDAPADSKVTRHQHDCSCRHPLVGS
jgi:hypothetical protein